MTASDKQAGSGHNEADDPEDELEISKVSLSSSRLQDLLKRINDSKTLERNASLRPKQRIAILRIRRKT